jgi:2-oxoglutarate ferredoxin oxidoreductase subunit alpha
MTSARRVPVSLPTEEIESVTIRFCGDSGDGMQLAGAKLTHASVRMGNVVCSVPDYPAEIRAPAGTLAGVSGYQVHISSLPRAIPGDRVNALVAMNPAALQANIKDVERNGLLLVNSDTFTGEELAKAGYRSNPLHDGSLAGFRLFPIPMDQLHREAVAKLKLTPKELDRCKNFFALGLVCWLYDRSLEPILKWIKSKFVSNPGALEGNSRALKAGYRFGETSDLFPTRYAIPKAELPAGQYRHLTGTEGLLLGLRAAGRLAGRPLVFSTSPLLPASEMLHRLLEHPDPEVRAVQAEDDSGAAGMAVGAAFGGAIGACAASGGGLSQMADMIGLAVTAELPIVVIDVQRGGPSSGLPTKTEQADLLLAVFGRNGEAPLPVLAPSSPGDCFATALEAVRIACRFMTPVLLLTDLFLSSGAEPWRIPRAEDLAPIESPHAEPGHGFRPYQRNAWLARPWAAAGTPGLEHRIGGLEKEDGTGAVSYDPINHEKMVQLRAAKLQRLAQELPEWTADGPSHGDLLAVSWGSTCGTVATAVQRLQRPGHSVAHAHLRYLNPFPRNTSEILRRYRRILVPELNRGQLRQLLRSEFLLDVAGFSKVQGRPFLVGEVAARIEEELSALQRSQ